MTDHHSVSQVDVLKTIVAAARRIVEVRAQRESLSALARRAERRAARRGCFRQSLQHKNGCRVIAECKRRSPSRGILRRSYDPATVARGYQAAGAAAVSVLTEPTFFDGSLAHLEAVRAVVDLPILRKDFVVTEYQLLEARAAGADAVLLIVAALEPTALRALTQRADSLDLDVLVEVHDATELEMATDAGASIIGVNNRDLKTLTVSVQTSESLIERIPDGVASVSESGLRTPMDLARLGRLGFDAFLIGERFMAEADPGAALRTLLDGVPAPVSSGTDDTVRKTTAGDGDA